MSLIGGELDSVGGNIFRELYRKNQLPDLVLFTKHSQYDFYHWAKEDILLDFSQFAEEELYDEDLYYQEVL